MPTEEEIKALQEKMKNMSPEELKELQKQQCVFCQIIAGKVNSKKIYEDDKCLAILDINPANPGHTLLMPKEHYPLMPLMPEDVIDHLFMVAKSLSRSMLTAVNAEGTNIFIANGVAAGQRAQHFMLHIIPRRPGDNVKMEIPVNEFPENDVKKISKAISDKIGIIFQQKKEVVGPEKKQKEEKPKEEKPQEKSKEKKEPKKKSKKKKEEGVSLDEIANLLK